MKTGYIALFVGLLLFGVIGYLMDQNSPKFKVGDCIQYQPLYSESWDSPFRVQRIEKIGNYSYKVSWFDNTDRTWNNSSFNIYFTDNSKYKKVDCMQ